jgi:hypothetical protein
MGMLSNYNQIELVFITGFLSVCHIIWYLKSYLKACQWLNFYFYFINGFSSSECWSVVCNCLKLIVIVLIKDNNILYKTINKKKFLSIKLR